jgi:hypothetical protein
VPAQAKSRRIAWLTITGSRTVINWLREDPTLGAKVLKDKLEQKYYIKVSYYVVWDDKQMALDEVMGDWQDNFVHVFS